MVSFKGQGSRGPSWCLAEFDNVIAVVESDAGLDERMSYAVCAETTHRRRNPQIVNQASGTWQSAAKVDLGPYIQFLKWNIHALQRFWKFGTAAQHQQFIQCRPRAQNLSCEDLTHGVVENGEAVTQTYFVQLVANDMLVLSSSGFKGDSGSSCAAVLHVYRHEVGWIILGKWGIPMGHCTKVVAEFEGACLSIRLLMLWCIQSKKCVLVS